MPQSALLLGSGFVATPAVEVLSKAGVHVTVACRTLASAKNLAGTFDNTKAVSLDVNDSAALEQAVSEHDITISLIPYTFHAAVIKAAIKAKKNVVTTSYVSPAMEELHEEAKAAGITVLNEIGLYAVSTTFTQSTSSTASNRREARSSPSRATVVVFPPLRRLQQPPRYKFSWSSRGVLLALKNNAKYYEDNKLVDISGVDLMSTAQPYHSGYLGFNFVAYGNRDSTGYRERYRIPDAETVVRGTMRYNGFPQFVKALVDIGFLSTDEQDFFKQSIPWKDALQKFIGANSSSEEDLTKAILSKTSFKDESVKNQVLAGLKWIGVFSDVKTTPRGTALDTLCASLEQKMAYEKGERDIVFLQHTFEVINKDGSQNTWTSTLVEYGAPEGSGGFSAMSRLVGVPCGVATKMVLDGTITDKGVVAPVYPSLARTLMNELKNNYGIECKEKIIA
uniref:Saccharopine dehydrogenase n=1 Tax=Gibberella zeae (strain ATCC MYA-4620 / CBS 123657 / FGSC 9075 / NRRL 31084 / PH-1) TaxID=229533 RepID=A0A098D1D9_GIBZE